MQLWPLIGGWTMLTTPRWWPRTLLVMALGWMALLGGFIAVIVWRWPAPDITGWAWTWAAIQAIAWATTTLLATWIVVLPLVMWLALENLARQVLRSAGVEPVELSLWCSVMAGLRVTLNTMPQRLGWAGAGIAVGFVAGPAGLVIGAIGMGQIACLDALDVALALRGFTGLERVRILQAHRTERLQAGVVAGLTNLLAASTVILWPLWLPGIVVGAAQRVAKWPDATPRGAYDVGGSIAG